MILITLETHFRALPSCFHFHTIHLSWEGKHTKNEKRKEKRERIKGKKIKDKRKGKRKKGNNGRLTPAKKEIYKEKKEKKRNHKAPKKNINLQPF
jgi:hypothetical protein